MPRSGSLWLQIVNFDKTKMEPWVGFRSALGVSLSVIIGYLLHSPIVGLCIAIGALNVCYSDKSDSYLHRAKRMFGSACLSGLAVFAGVYAGNNPILMFSILTLGAFFTGMLVVVDTMMSEIGVIIVATFLIFSGQAMPVDSPIHLGFYAFAGGMLQSILSVALWPVRRYNPERRALRSLYLDLANLAVTKAKATSTPLGSARSMEAQAQFTALAGDTRAEARRYRSLLSQAERLRITLLSLARIKRRLMRENEAHYSLHVLESVLKSASYFLNAVAEAINSRSAEKMAQLRILDIEDQIQRIQQQRSSQEAPFYAAVLNDLIYQLEAMAEQLRAIKELSEKTTAEGIEADERKEAAKPLHLRYWGWLAAIQANLTFRSPGFRHSVRLSLCVAIGEMVSFALKLDRAYWLPITILVVLKPDYASTFHRSFSRVLGSLAGLLLATVLFHYLFYYLPSGPWLEVGLIFAFTFLMRWLGSANYGLFAMCLSALVVLLIALTGVAPKDVIWARGINTVLGGTIALLIYWLWPTSEKLQMSEAIARMLEGYREYFHAVVHQKLSGSELDRIRQGSRVARTNFQQALERFIVERGAEVEEMKILSALTAASNRFAHASMSLEAGSPRDLSQEQSKAFSEFVQSVEKTLQLLSKALVGDDIPHKEFPDVRAALVNFTKLRSDESQAFGLMYAETDRATNSLNTIKEYVLKHLALKRRARKESF